MLSDTLCKRSDYMASCLHCEHHQKERDLKAKKEYVYCKNLEVYTDEDGYKKCENYYPDYIDEEDDFKYIPKKYHFEYKGE